MIKTNSHISKSKLAIIVISAFAIAFIFIIRWNGLSGENYRNIIKSDGIGYYNYFPTFINGTTESQDVNYTFLNKIDTNIVVNKYSIGTALVMSPFVITTYLGQWMTTEEVDFYSEYFQKSVSIAALFYLILGLSFLRKLLLLYNLQTRSISFTLFAIFFATNLSYYALLEPSMSHVYSFAFISLFCYLVKLFSYNPKSKLLIFAAAILAIISLIRPVNIIILFAIPILTNNNYKLAFSWLTNNIKHILYSLAVFIAIIFIQLIAWYIQTGNLFLWSYSNEGFYFSNPEIQNFLFSFRKGFFIYTPFALLAIITFFISFRKKKSILIKITLFFSLVFYILSSWWNWYYGDSYGSRVMIDFLPIIALIFALSLDKFNILGQRIIVIIAFVLVLLNVFQSYQYYYNIMSRYDMNFEKYKYIFGKFGSNNSWILGGNNDIIKYHKAEPSLIIDDTVKSISNNFIYTINGESLMDYQSTYLEFSCISKLIKGDMSSSYWKLSLLSSSGKEYILGNFKVNEVPLQVGQSRYNKYSINLPKPISINDKFCIERNNPFHTEFTISDMKIKVSGINNN